MMTRRETATTRRRLYEWLVLFACLGLVAAVLLYVHQFEVARSQTAELDRLHVLTDFVANDIQGNLTVVNRSVEGVVRDYLSAPQTPVSSHFLTLRLQALAVTIPGARALLVLDRNGQVTHSSRTDLPQRDLSKRTYFTQVRAHPNVETLYISPPFQSLRPEDDLVITATRMVPDASGGFNGALVVVLNKEFFSAPFSVGIYAPDVWAIVVHGDGLQIMNFPDKGRHIDGTNLNRPGTFFRRHQETGQIESVLSGQVYTTGEQRLMNLRTIRPRALHMDRALVIGLSREQAAMAVPLRHQVTLFGLLFCSLLLACCGALAWMQRRRAQAEATAAALEHSWREAEEVKRLGKVERDSEQRFRTLIEDAPLAIAILRGGVFIYTNPRYRDLHGYAPGDDLAGLPWNAMIMPAARSALAEQEALIVADSPAEQKFEALGLGKGGRAVPIFKTTTRVELVDGPATLIFAQDISAQKSAETALLRARDVAEAASRSKADFLANMSHEIRSPLNAILGLAYLLEQSQLSFDTHGMVRKIQTSGRMLLGIINDILDVSKIEAGHMEIEQVAFRLGDVVDNIAATMGIAVGDKDIQLIIQPTPAGVDALIGDPLRLEQVLSNLTSNAIKFTQAGRVEVFVTQQARSADTVTLRFCVNDTGIGIAPELHEDVFSVFTQADTSTTRRFGGSGLGLTICRQLVTLMGGQMGLDSTPGQGSQFWFTLPFGLIADTEFSSPDMVRIEALIADDSDIALKAIGEIATGLGWQVKAVNSGEAVLAQLRSSWQDTARPRVVILDWKMPGMDGLQTARAIRATLTDDACPIVIMATASSLATMTSQPGAELVDAVLYKPVTASALYNATIEAQRRRETGLSALLPVPQRGLDGVRLLVVDDSEINRDVAQRILEAQGAKVYLAVDGRHALDWLAAHPDEVDVVLMDVQMPVMDGIEATRQLRLQRRFDDLPIVALTAGAFKSQQEAARAAGMTHFVSKPFDVPTTISLIQRVRRGAPASASVAPASTASAPLYHHARYAGLVDPHVIDIERGLQVWTDMTTYRNYLRHFSSSYSGSVESMRACLAASDFAASAALAHKLAGVAGNMGLPETHRLAMEAERVLTGERDPDDVLTRLTTALAQVMAEIDKVAPPVAAASTPADQPDRMTTPVTPDVALVLAPLFAALLAAIDTDNPAPVEPALGAIIAHLPLAELAAIRQQVASFDFRAAEMATRHLAAALGLPP